MAKTQRTRTLVALDAAREALDEAREALTATVGPWTPTTAERSDEAREALGEAMSILSALGAALEPAAQIEPARGNGQLVPTNTRHSGFCATQGAWGRYDTENCARCRELDAGAAPRRGWGAGPYG